MIVTSVSRTQVCSSKVKLLHSPGTRTTVVRYPWWRVAPGLSFCTISSFPLDSTHNTHAHTVHPTLILPDLLVVKLWVPTPINLSSSQIQAPCSWAGTDLFFLHSQVQTQCTQSSAHWESFLAFRGVSLRPFYTVCMSVCNAGPSLFLNTDPTNALSMD